MKISFNKTELVWRRHVNLPFIEFFALKRIAEKYNGSSNEIPVIRKDGNRTTIERAFCAPPDYPTAIWQEAGYHTFDERIINSLIEESKSY